MRKRRLRLLPLLLAAFTAGCDGDARAGRDLARLHALVDSMLPTLAQLASLPVLEDVRLERRDSAAVHAYVERRLDEELPPDALERTHTTWSLLGLIPDTLDLRALMLRLYGEQIVGYYDPAERTLYVVEGVAADAVAPVLAHELVHALQDQHANLDSLIARERGSDPQTAAHAALEGHATMVMFAWLAGQGRGGPVDPLAVPNPATELAAGLRAQNEQFPVFRSAPLVIRESLLFPYVAGADFVYHLWQAQPERRPAPLGQWLPQSTEQVLHPGERFLSGRDRPLALGIAPCGDETAAARDDDGFGELGAALFLQHHLGDDARALARGWAGDRYRLLRGPGGAPTLLWYSAWDDEPAAARFAEALARVAATPGSPRLEVSRSTLGGRPLLRVVVTRDGAAAALPPACLETAGTGVL